MDMNTIIRLNKSLEKHKRDKREESEKLPNDNSETESHEPSLAKDSKSKMFVKKFNNTVLTKAGIVVYINLLNSICPDIGIYLKGVTKTNGNIYNYYQ